MLVEGYCELGGRSIANGTVRSDLVVVPSPGGDERFGMLDGCEPMLVEALVAELAVEAFDVGVLGGLAGMDQDELHVVYMRTLIQ